MIIYKPTGQVFENRKEARIALGSAFYNRLEKEKKDLLFTNMSSSATNEVYKNSENISQSKRRD